LVWFFHGLIADIAIFAGSHPPSVPETPPLVVVEILSNDDRYLDLMQKLEEYRDGGVPHISASPTIPSN
jgi:Uma2 family endonuclease